MNSGRAARDMWRRSLCNTPGDRHTTRSRETYSLELSTSLPHITSPPTSTAACASRAARSLALSSGSEGVPAPNGPIVTMPPRLWAPAPRVSSQRLTDPKLSLTCAMSRGRRALTSSPSTAVPTSFYGKSTKVQPSTPETTGAKHLAPARRQAGTRRRDRPRSARHDKVTSGTNSDRACRTRAKAPVEAPEADAPPKNSNNSRAPRQAALSSAADKPRGSDSPQRRHRSNRTQAAQHAEGPASIARLAPRKGALRGKPAPHRGSLSEATTRCSH